MSDKSFVNLENARLQEQEEVMKHIKKEGLCPFCTENLQKFHKEPILKETKHWLLTKNQWPYKNTRVHFLIITKQHAEKLSDLPPEAGSELLAICKWIEKEYNIDGGALGMRFGSPEKNGGTVKHLHAQLLTVNTLDKNNPKYSPVRFRVG